ncbi:MAG: methylated-DNA--[protein]-cysteine S-methyltransferase [Acidobacteria bacterium]|nr:MAG: methylated-DNA--[protein]-cysteine S-methyltransferase [Acidobacteriota bacterium]
MEIVEAHRLFGKVVRELRRRPGGQDQVKENERQQKCQTSHALRFTIKRVSRVNRRLRYHFPVTEVYSRNVETPIGRILVAATPAGVCRVCFPTEPPGQRYQWFNRYFATLPIEERNPVVDRAVSEIEEYFARQRHSFDVPLDLHGTEFRLRVWTELAKVPFGATTSYGELARRVGKPGAARAIGNALHNNPVPIIVPCHRVIGHDRRLVGFGGGLSVKEQLLEIEQDRMPLFE